MRYNILFVKSNHFYGESLFLGIEVF